MPGTIQVTVLEFKGVSNSSKPSAKSLKVSMGKRQYQTWDKGEFSFPISKLREDLVVTLLDAGGNEIAHANIRTMQIIEKGSWDEVFSINGGGHVHMKLQFILSDEERDRIRIMRESAMKKKLEMNPKINLKLSETIGSTSDSLETSTKNEEKVSESPKEFVEIDVVSPKDEASQAGSSLNSATSSSISLSSHQNEAGNILETAIPNTTDGNQGAPSSPGKHDINTESPQVHKRVVKTAVFEKNNLVALKLKDDPPVEKTPRNVRKMISAFENSQIQEVKPLKKAQSVPSQLNRFKKEGLLENREPKAVVHAANTSLMRNFKDNFAGNLREISTSVSARAGMVSSDTEPSQSPKELASNVKRVKDSNTEDMSTTASRESTLEKLSVDLMRQSTSERATSSGRMNEGQSQITLNSSVSSSVAEGSGRERRTSLKSSTMINIQVKPKSLESYKEECQSAQSSGMWIFPDNTRPLCITTAGKHGRNILGHQHNNDAKTRQGKKISSESQGLEEKVMHKTEKNLKNFDNQPESGFGGSSPDNSSNGLVKQVIKIAVIVGFGVLVLLTRQKEPRKNHRKENDNLFPIADYVD